MTDPAYFSARVVSSRRFWISGQEAEGRLAVLSGGYEFVASDYRVERDGFPQPVIELVAGGQGTLTLGGRDWRLAPGMIFVYGPGVPVRMVTESKAALRKYFLVVGGGEASTLLAAARIFPGVVATLADPQPILDLCDQIIRYGQESGPSRARACAVTAEYLLLRLAQEVTPVGQADAGAIATFRRCHRLIEERFLEVRSQAGIAALCNLEPSYLCRLYRRFAHESPYHHLRRLRLHHALSRLQAGANVAVVADEVGYSDPAHFSRAFQQCFGLPPSRARSGGPVL